MARLSRAANELQAADKKAAVAPCSTDCAHRWGWGRFGPFLASLDSGTEGTQRRDLCGTYPLCGASLSFAVI